MSDADDIETEALKDIAYLARSSNRVRVLDELTPEDLRTGQGWAGYTRRELEDMTGGSRPTLSRILTEFEDRGWVERTNDGRYIATRRGELVAAQFSPVVDSLGTVEELGPVADLLPIEELTVGPNAGVPVPLAHFRDATIRRPKGFDPDDFSRYLIRFVEDATRFYWVTYVGPSEKLATAINEHVVGGPLRSKGIYPSHLVEHYQSVGPIIHDDDIRDQLRDETWEEVGLEWHSYDGHLPCNLFIFDETVIIENSQVRGIDPGTVIEVRDETVRYWALELFERYLDRSEQVKVPQPE